MGTVLLKLVVVTLAILSTGSPAFAHDLWFSEPGGEEMLLEVSARATTGNLPKSVTVSPDGSRVIVCNFGRPEGDNVTIHDAEDLSVIHVIRGFEGNAVEALYSRDGKTLYITNFRRQLVHVFDAETYEKRRDIEVGANPKMMITSLDDQILYVANWSHMSVSVVDVEQGVELYRLRTDRHPRGMVVGPDDDLYVASMRGDIVQVFPRGAQEESRRFPTCPFPRHLVLGPDPSVLYITCTLGSMGAYERETGRRLGYAATARNPRSLDISPDGRYLATANFHSSDVSLADLTRRTHLTSRVPGGDQLVGLAMHPGQRLRVYATSWMSNEVIAMELRNPELAAAAGPAVVDEPSVGDEATP